MPKIIYRFADGKERVIDVESGTSVMRAALENDVPGLIGECGGQAMCATCHVYVFEATDCTPSRTTRTRCSTARRPPVTQIAAGWAAS